MMKKWIQVVLASLIVVFSTGFIIKMSNRETISEVVINEVSFCYDGNVIMFWAKKQLLLIILNCIIRRIGRLVWRDGIYQMIRRNQTNNVFRT